GYWRFDEATGATAADLSSTAALATQRTIPATESKLFRFQGEAGGHLFLNVLSTAGATLTARVYRPDGQLLHGPASLAYIDLADLPQTGTYTLLVEGRGDGGNAQFTAEVLEVIDTETTLTIGATTSGHIDPGSQTVHR